MNQNSNHIFPRDYADYLKTIPFLGRFTGSHHEITAGSIEEVTLIYEVGSAGLADGAWFKAAFKYYSDWALFQTESPDAENYLSVEYRPRKEFFGESPATVRELKVRFDQKGHERPYQKAVIVDVVDGYLNPGDQIVIRLGDRRFGGQGTRVQTFVENEFRFRGYVDTAGTSRFSPVPEDVVIHFKPGDPFLTRLLTPRVVRPSVSFPVTVRNEDRWGNIAEDQKRNSLFSIWNSKGELVGKFPLSVEGAGWGRGLVVIQESGDYQISIDGERKWTSTPISVTASIPFDRPFFADLHVHSHDTVGTLSTRENLTFARDPAGLDIVGYTVNDFQIREDHWNEALQICHELNRKNEFVCYPGTEWCGTSSAGGDRNVIFLGDEVIFPRSHEGKSLRSFEWNEFTPAQQKQVPGAWPISELHQIYREDCEKILMIPHVGGRRANWDWHDGDLERLVEISSSWGHFDWFYREALARGYHVGASAAGDEHRGRPGGGAPGVGSFGVFGGLTGVWSSSLDREEVGKALRARKTWATTGTRSVALLRAGDRIQGEEIRSETGIELPVHYELWTESPLERVELRNRHQVIHEIDFHRQLGYSSKRFRIRWGGARIRDRYRWAEWRIGVKIVGAKVLSSVSRGFEHPEERVFLHSEGVFEIRSDTYGDSDHWEIEVDSLKDLQIDLAASIFAYDKTGKGLHREPDPRNPGGNLSVAGKELLETGGTHISLGGEGLFISVEPVTDAKLPLHYHGEWSWFPQGNDALYLYARLQDEHQIWSSPIYLV